MDADGTAESEEDGQPGANPTKPDVKKPDADKAGRPGASSRAAGPAPKDRVEPPNLEGQTVYAIDANSLIFQVFHAIPEMTSPRGEPVSAVYGFTRDVVKLIEEKKPDYLFVAFDRAEKTFRHDVFEDYKAHRAEVPVDLAPQFGSIVRLLHALGVCVLDCAGYEADDLLATIAHQTDAASGNCVLVTGDKDCRQLITERVTVYNVRKDQMFDAAALKQEWGIRPEQVVDFQALVGDSVDNIPGVPLIGPKVAREYLEKYDTLEALFEHAAELPKGKRRDNLIAGRQQAFVSRELARLERQVPIALDWEAARVGRPGGVDTAAVAELCAEFGFRGLAEKLAKLAQGGAASPGAAAPADVECQAIDTPEKLADFVQHLRVQKQIAIHVETGGAPPRWAETLGYAFAWEAGRAFYLPVRVAEDEPHLNPDETLAALRAVLEDPAVEKVGHNLKYAMVVLRAAGVEMAGAHFDSMVASYLLDAGERNHSLEELAARYLDHKKTNRIELTGSGKGQKRIEDVPLGALARFAAEEADLAWRLRPILEARLAEEHLDELFTTLELPLIAVLVELESNGVRIDVQRLAQLSARYGKLLTALEREIYELAGREFNIGSPKQLGQVLFDEHKLPMLKKTKTGGSTDVDVLEELALVHPLPAKIIEYRQYAKLKNTYVDALPQLVHPRTGRVHTSFNQVVAATGRLSSNDPNLQNIPVRNENGREIRAAFLPGPEGWRLLAADYSQVELRLLAHFSGDRTLAEAFARDEDVHARVATQLYGVTLGGVTPEMRRAAKAVNFGVIYGQSPFGLAKQLGIEQAAAAEFIDAYFDGYPGVEEFLTKLLEEGRRKGYVSTILGRRRAIRGIRTGAGRQRNLPERTAINTVIQGSQADLIKLAMIHIHRRLRQDKLSAKMLLQIHDELIFEVHTADVDSLAKLVSLEMSGVMRLDVPLKVDVKSGSTWADCEPLNEDLGDGN